VTLVIFSLAAALGAVLRFEFEKLSAQKLGERFPYGTLLVNVFGSFLLGYSLSRSSWSAEILLFAASFCGAFTTFGGFIGQTHHRLRHQTEQPIAIIYIALTIGLSLFAAWLGLNA
jgi:CrcB protein